MSAPDDTGSLEHPGRRADGDEAFSHLDPHGHARMVDVTGKDVTERRAVARGVVRAAPDAIATALKSEELLPFAKASGMLAAKRAPDLIPLCHPLPLDDVEIDLDVTPGEVTICATTNVFARTGVEMEALTACAVSGLTLVMALLPYDLGAVLTTLALWHKSGGRSGTWARAAAG